MPTILKTLEVMFTDWSTEDEGLVNRRQEGILGQRTLELYATFIGNSMLIVFLAATHSVLS